MALTNSEIQRINQIFKQIDTLNNQLKSKDDIISKTELEVRNLTVENQKLLKEINARQVEIVKLQQELSVLQGTATKVTSIIDDLKADIKSIVSNVVSKTTKKPTRATKKTSSK